MFPERRVRLFRNGRNQAVRIPREFELPGKSAVMRKEGDKLIMEPSRRNLYSTSWRLLRRLTRSSPRSVMHPLARSNFDGLLARHQHHLRNDPQSAWPGNGAHPRCRPRTSSHQYHSCRRVAVRRHQRRDRHASRPRLRPCSELSKFCLSTSQRTACTVFSAVVSKKWASPLAATIC